MTHPQDPEQQAIEAWMKSKGFKHRGSWWYLPSYDWAVLSPEAATFFYRATQAQVAEARYDEIDTALRIYDEVPPRDLAILLRDLRRRREELIAQLNPQKPNKEEQ